MAYVFTDAKNQPVDLNDIVQWKSDIYGIRSGRIVRLDQRIRLKWRYQHGKEEVATRTVVVEVTSPPRMSAKRIVVKTFWKL